MMPALAVPYRGLQAAFPSATVFGVCAGHNPTAQEFGRARRIEKRYDFQQECPEGERPPFPSSLCYDSKGWLCARERAAKCRGVVLECWALLENDTTPLGALSFSTTPSV
jgi:hypothetical protein